ncbi:MAG: D-Ala-D-Ala carboxypeptidase family metallohydrolase [bacterium]
METNKKLSEHFTRKEFECPCCGQAEIDPELIALLEKIRASLGGKVVVTSGYRCRKHNRKVGGAEGSYHCRGMAADIKVEGAAPERVAKCAESILGGGGGVGRYGSWTHVDSRVAKARWRG